MGMLILRRRLIPRAVQSLLPKRTSVTVPVHKDAKAGWLLRNCKFNYNNQEILYSKNFGVFINVIYHKFLNRNSDRWGGGDRRGANLGPYSLN